MDWYSPVICFISDIIAIAHWSPSRHVVTCMSWRAPRRQLHGIARLCRISAYGRGAGRGGSGHPGLPVLSGTTTTGAGTTTGNGGASHPTPPHPPIMTSSSMSNTQLLRISTFKMSIMITSPSASIHHGGTGCTAADLGLGFGCTGLLCIIAVGGGGRGSVSLSAESLG